MKYLKNFTELILESTMYNKSEMINLLLIEMDAHIYGEEELRRELSELPHDKFDELVQQYGYKELDSNHWTPDYSKKKIR